MSAFHQIFRTTHLVLGKLRFPNGWKPCSRGRAEPSGEREIKNWHGSPMARERCQEVCSDSNQRWLNQLYSPLCPRRWADGTAAGNARCGEGIWYTTM